MPLLGLTRRPPGCLMQSRLAELLDAAQKNFHAHGERGFVKIKAGVMVGEIQAPIGVRRPQKAIAARQGLILVDTKYEFGKIGDTIYLMDEIHTPDSSRYFYAAGFEEKQQK